MIGYALLMMVTASNDTVPVKILIPTKQECLDEGKRADDIAKKLKGVKVTWQCREVNLPDQQQEEDQGEEVSPQGEAPDHSF